MELKSAGLCKIFAKEPSTRHECKDFPDAVKAEGEGLGALPLETIEHIACGPRRS